MASYYWVALGVVSVPTLLWVVARWVRHQTAKQLLRRVAVFKRQFPGNDYAHVVLEQADNGERYIRVAASSDTADNKIRNEWRDWLAGGETPYDIRPSNVVYEWEGKPV